jgi:hypothetical protein
MFCSRGFRTLLPVLFAGVVVVIGTQAATPATSAVQFSLLTHREAEWYGSTFWAGPDWTRVGKDWQHPGESTPSVRRFDAPRAGRVTITGRVFKRHLAGDGIRARIRHNEREVWKAEVGGKDAQGLEPVLTLEIKSGDALRFIVDKRGNIGSDTTGWDPVVAYGDGERFQASVSFGAKKQGAGGWFYEMVGEGRPGVPGKASVLGPASFPEPPTVALSAADADELLASDWRAQRGSTPVGVACRQELTRADRILQRISGRLAPAEQARWQRTLANWRGRLAEESSDELYLGLRRMKRELLLADPVIDFTGLLCIDNPYVHGSEAVHEIRHRNEDTATPGGRLLVLDGLRPDARVRKLAPSGVAAAFWRPDLSFDGTKVLFCMKAADQPAYHLYEVGLDGSGWRQITEGDYNDLDPIYAPDGGIIFSTTRCNHYLRCGGSKFRMFILARCDRDGKNIYFISANNEADYAPSFLPDGRIIYTRWEYVDKSVLRVQSLWTVNPDGTGASTFWGNQSKWPDMLLNARVIPGTNQIVFSATGHHDAYAGPLGVVAPDEGLNYPDGVYNLTPHTPWAEVGAGPADKPYNKDFQAPPCYGAFQTPFPISRDLLLVSARVGPPVATLRDPELSWFQLYLMDYDGNMELLYKGAFNVLHAQPIRARLKPHIIPTNVRWPGKMIAADQSPAPGILLSSDVYEGSGIPRGLVKSLRVLEIESQSYCDGIRSTNTEANIYRTKGAFPNYNLSGETPTSFLYDEGTKRILGTVPVEADGSVHFKVPPVRSIYFQLLDEKGRCLQTMRSFTHVMPGETRGCVGCHETSSATPYPKATFLALQRPPSDITPPPWGEATVSFPRFVQPVLDRHCIECHRGAEPKGGLDLTHRTEPGTSISWPYVKLVFGHNPKTPADLAQTTIAGPLFPYHVYPNPAVKFPTEETAVPPMTAMSYRSRLIALATSGEHHDVRVSPDEEARLVAWVDALCPYLGLEEILAEPDIAPKDYYDQAVFSGLSFPPKMRTAPVVHKAFAQEEFKTQSDRLPRDAAGNVLPSVEIKDGRRTYQIPVKGGR